MTTDRPRGLGRAEIEAKKSVPIPVEIRLGDLIAAQFGQVLPDPEDPADTEIRPAYRPTRAERRARERAVARELRRAERHRG